DEEGVVLGCDLSGCLGEVQGDVVGGLDHEKMGKPGWRRQAEDARQEGRGSLLVTARDDGVVQLHAHLGDPAQRSGPANNPTAGHYTSRLTVSTPPAARSELCRCWQYRGTSSPRTDRGRVYPAQPARGRASRPTGQAAWRRPKALRLLQQALEAHGMCTFWFRWWWARWVTVRPGRGRSLVQRLERLPDLLREQFGLFPGGEVAALGGLVEVDEVG